MTFWFELVLAVFVGVVLEYTDGSNFDLGQDPILRIKRSDADSHLKGFSGLGEADQGFMRIKPNKILVEKSTQPSRRVDVSEEVRPSKVDHLGFTNDSKKDTKSAVSDSYKKLQETYCVTDTSTFYDTFEEAKQICSQTDGCVGLQGRCDSTHHTPVYQPCSKKPFNVARNQNSCVWEKISNCPAVCCDGNCPSGYCHKCGENVGGILHDGQKMKTLEDCSKLCEEHPDCHSFNWSPSYKGGWCSTNTNSEYVKDQIGDFILCFKSKFCGGDKQDLSANNSMNELDETRIVGDRVSGGRRFLKLNDEKKDNSGSHSNAKGLRGMVTSNWEYPSEEDFVKRFAEESKQYKQPIPDVYDHNKAHNMYKDMAEGLRKVGNKGKKMKSRAPLNRKRPVGVWPMAADKDGGRKCGFPVCAMLDAKPKRFRSMCKLVQYMKEKHLTQRVLHIQKGDCADAIQRKQHRSPWGEKNHRGCSRSSYHQDPSEEKICAMMPDDKKAYTFSVCELLNKKLWDRKDIITIHIGLGACKNLLDQTASIKTEWFDTDDPCLIGDYESYYSSITSVQEFKLSWRFRNCLQDNKGDNDVFLTTDDKDIRARNQILTPNYSKRELWCRNEDNQDRRNANKVPRSWYNRKITCDDYKVQHSCKCLYGCYGTPEPRSGKPDADDSEAIKVILPRVRTLFDECTWQPFVSFDFPHSNTWDIEMRSRAFGKRGDKKHFKKHVCGENINNAMYIDVRTIKDDTPWDETGETITKITPQWGFACLNKNNERNLKHCSDYKVRYCCGNVKHSYWNPWSEWSPCTKTCGTGTSTRKHTCKNQAAADCIGQKTQERECNRAHCPVDHTFTNWGAWGACPLTCIDHGDVMPTQKRRRNCKMLTGYGARCPDEGHGDNWKFYTDVKKCELAKCPYVVPSQWSPWSKCKGTCGVGIKRATRSCIEQHSKVEKSDEECKAKGQVLVGVRTCDNGPCPVDGGWTKWQNWGRCSVGCGEGTKVRIQRCADPARKNDGKPCDGGKTDAIGNQIRVGRGKCMAQEDGKPKPCPIDCTWSDWGEWSKCSLTCGNFGDGIMQRLRHVAIKDEHGGEKCDGDIYQSRSCPHKDCSKICKDKARCICQKDDKRNARIPKCPIDRKWSAWGPWSECRDCYKNSDNSYKRSPDGKSIPLQILKKAPSHRNQNSHRYQNKLRDFCDMYLGACFTRKRGVDTYEENGGKAEGKNAEYKVCRKGVHIKECPREALNAWGPWQPWSDCIGRCGKKGRLVRKRKCLTFNGGRCNGKNSEERKCPSMCPQEKGWGDWNAWSPCAVTCGKGTIGRQRVCLGMQHPELMAAIKSGDKGIPKNFMECHEMNQKETRECDMGRCDSYGWKKNKETGRYEKPHKHEDL